MKRIAAFLGLGRSMIGLLGMVVLVGMGEKMAERFLPLYLVALGGGVLSVGLLNGLDNLLSALYSYLGGYLADRLGTRRSLILFNLLAIFGFIIVVLFPSWQAVIVGSLFFLSWTAISLPATMGLVAGVLPARKRTMGVSMHSLIRRVPMSLGPLAGGLIILKWGEVQGVRLAFLGAIAMALLALFLQQALIEDDRRNTQSVPATPEVNPFRMFRLMNPALRSLLISDILIRFCEQIPYPFVVLWCMREISNPVNAFQFGILTTVEMVTAILIYIPVAYLADRSGKKPFVVITFVFFMFFPLVLLFSHSFLGLVPVFILRGLKEFGEPTRKALILDLAPEDRKATMFGLYYLFRDMVVSVAAFGGAFLWQVSPAANFMTAFAFGMLGTLWFILRGKDMPEFSHCKPRVSA